jgi:hypothetical protein
MDLFLLKLCSGVSVPAPSCGGCVERRYVYALNSEIAVLGYTLDGGLIEKIAALSPSDFASFRKDTLDGLTEVSGESANHATLFRKFPYDTPDKNVYLLSRIVGYLQHDLGHQPNDCEVLSCGHVIDKSLFNLDDFGACPICQQQVAELDGHEDAPRHDFKSVTPLKVLRAVDDAFLKQTGDALLTRKSSLSEDEKTLLKSLKDRVVFDRPTAVYRENLPFVYDLFGDRDLVANLLSGATDVLRIATYVSAPDADLSLASNTRFRFTNAQKRDLMCLIETLGAKSWGNLLEDMLRHRERWLRVGERLKVGSDKNKARFPVTFAAFDNIRNTQKSIPTFNRTVEKDMRALTVTPSMIQTLEQRPGEFMRRLDFMLRTGPDQEAVIRALVRVIPNVTPRLLLDVMKHLEGRGTAAQRVFIPKGQINRVQVVADNRAAIDPIYVQKAVGKIQAELFRRILELPPFGKVYVDPTVGNALLPFNRRGDSSTTTPMAKGSRFAVNGDVIRMFVHWTGRDVDLSVVLKDNDFKDRGHVSYTRLSGTGMVHSGDIQSAPNGASEFIDIDIAKVLATGARYVGMHVISYSGGNFDTFPCFAGFMERDALKSGQKFEPEAVRLKFDINTPRTAHMPLVLDLVTREVIFVDLAVGGGRYGAVHNQVDKTTALLRAAVELKSHKPTVGDVMTMHTMIRGEIVGDKTEADIVIDQDIDLMAFMRDYVEVL